MEALAKRGVAFTKNSGLISFQELLTMIYKTSDMDLEVGNVSIVSGDPDGLYHVQGKYGAILAPMSFRQSIGDLLESGRDIVDGKLINEHYQKISKEILKEVPYVHLGFAKDVVIYNKKAIQVVGAKERNEHKLHVYKAI
jgi:hypothetical protein